MNAEQALTIVVNGFFTLGYLVGLVLVWVGLESIILDRADPGAGLLALALGMGAWAAASLLGRALARHHKMSSAPDPRR